MTTRYSSGSGSVDAATSRAGHTVYTATLIPDNTADEQRSFSSTGGPFTVGRTVAGADPADSAAQGHHPHMYTTTCPVVSRAHATFRWLPTGELAIVDSESHHGTYINDSVTRLTPGKAYSLQDQDTISFGKGIFKDGSFHAPHTVVVRIGTNQPPSPQKARSGTYGLKSPRVETRATPGDGSQSEAQANKIRTEVQRLGRRREVATKHKRQLQDVSSRLDYLEKNALDKNTSPQEVELRLRALERHYEALLDKLTSIEQNLRAPPMADDSSERGARRRRSSSEDEEGEITDDDEPTQPPPSRSSAVGTGLMVLVGGVAVWTALALS